MFPEPVTEILRRQDGVATRAQLSVAGARPHDLQRWRRRRELVMVRPGVYVDHTGGLSGRQRAWVAVLACGGRAALWGESALAAHEGTLDSLPDRPTWVGVDAGRTRRPPVGVRIRRVRGLEERVQWNRTPPRQRYEDAVLELAAGHGRGAAAVAMLAGAVASRRTTAVRLLEELAARPRISERAWLESVLGDIRLGTSSVLEHAYLVGVERAHGLPPSKRQVRGRASSGVVYRDVAYDDLLIELDGRTHDLAEQRDRDLERDLDAALAGLDTRRLGWRQVTDRPCVTASKVARLLVRRGWSGRPTPCSASCPVAQEQW